MLDKPDDKTTNVTSNENHDGCRRRMSFQCIHDLHRNSRKARIKIAAGSRRCFKTPQCHSANTPNPFVWQVFMDFSCPFVRQKSLFVLGAFGAFAWVSMLQTS